MLEDRKSKPKIHYISKMPQTPITVHGLQSTEIHEKIQLLTDNLVNIKDETGEFLLRLPDGRVIDTKGWQDWE